MSTNESVPVEQRDRDAAADLVRWQQGATKEWKQGEAEAWQFFVADFSKAIRQGIRDEHPVVQAFARHRIAGTPTAADEDAAEVKPAQCVYATILHKHRDAAMSGDEPLRAALFHLADMIHAVFPEQIDAWEIRHGGKARAPIPLTAERQRAEQAEQKLAEAVKVLRPFASHIDKRGETITLQWGRSTYTGTLKPEHFYAASDFLATIRSAASGEVGE